MAIVNNSIPSAAKTQGTSQIKKGTRVSAGVWRDPKTGKLYQSATGEIPGSKPAQTKPATQAPANTAPTQQTQPQQQVAPQPDPTFKPTSDFYQGNVANSPIYKQRLAEGDRALNARLASMGLSNSGASIRNELDLVNKLTADETARMQDLAVNDANRYDTTTENLANRRERLGQNQVDNVLKLAELYLNQNPMNYASQGQNTYNKTLHERAAGNANVIGSNTPLQTGGTGRPPPSFDPGFAAGPNTSQIDIFRILNGQQSGNDLMSLINGLYGMAR